MPAKFYKNIMSKTAFKKFKGLRFTRMGCTEQSKKGYYKNFRYKKFKDRLNQ